MNEIQIAFIQRKRVVEPQRDRRYRIMVSLHRSDRPKYWNFLCMHCSSKICEINNCDVYDIADFYDPENPRHAGNTKHCKGTLPNGTACPYTYFFNFG